jgi:probable HAF family extracellular repeat protein
MMLIKNALRLIGFLALVIATPLPAQTRNSRPMPPVPTYNITEIGTFGGNTSEFFDLNNASRVAGWAETADVDPTGCYGDGSLIFRGFVWRLGMLTEIGTFGGNNSQSNAINGDSTAAGFAETANADPNDPPCLTINAFLFRNGALTNLGTLDAGNNSQALGLNNQGQVVGYSETGDFDPNFGFPLIHAFAWNHGVLTELPTLGGASAAAGAINESGLVLGVSETSTDIDPVLGFADFHAALWQHGKIIDLGSLGGTFSGVGTAGSGLPFFVDRSFNPAGQVAGYAQTAIPSTDPVPEFTSFTPVPAPGFMNEVHAFRWQGRTMHDLGTLGGSFSEATALNSRGHTAGMSTSDHVPNPNNIDWFGVPFPTIHAALWCRGKAIDLGTLGGPVAEPFAINDHDQVVGWSVLSDNASIDAFLWQDGRMRDLNTLIPANSGWQLLKAVEINARGQIGGVGFLNGQVRAFLLTPSTNGNIAEPTALNATKPAISARRALDSVRQTQHSSYRMHR